MFEESLVKINTFNNSVISSHSDSRIELKINMNRNATIEGLQPYLCYYMLKTGFYPNINFATFNTVLEDLINTNSPIHQDDDAIELFFIDTNQFLMDNLNAEKAFKIIKEKVSLILENLILINKTIILNKLVAFAFHTEKSTAELDSINKLIAQTAKEYKHIHLLDLPSIIEEIGTAKVYDKRFLFMAKSPFSSHALNKIAFNLTRIINNLNGQPIKAIIVDADNTLWKGILGEDGSDNLAINQSQFPGNCYYEFQKQLIYLQSKGIILCLVSKNNENELIEFMNSSKNCLLKEASFAIHRINWKRKSENVLDIIQELNIGKESVIFIDDNPYEIEEVCTFIPGINTILLPSTPQEIPFILKESNLFNHLPENQIDVDKTQQYQTQATRNKFKSKFESFDDYLKSLEIVSTIEIVKEESYQRIAELTQKTNQFNLSTIRLDETKLIKFITNGHLVLKLDVIDKFGEYGLTGAAFIRSTQDGFFIENILLSCRILGKNIEQLFLKKIISMLQEIKSDAIIESQYIKSHKNSMTKIFYTDNNFKLISEKDSITKYLYNSKG